MIIKDLKELQALYKLCRKHGVTHFDDGTLKLVFGEMSPKYQNDGNSDIDTPDDLTYEQLAFLSAPGG